MRHEKVLSLMELVNLLHYDFNLTIVDVMAAYIEEGGEIEESYLEELRETRTLILEELGEIEEE